MDNRLKIVARFAITIVCLSSIALCPQTLNAHERSMGRSSREVYRGNILFVGGPRGANTEFFTLTIDSYTPDEKVQNLLGVLQRDGQDGLLKALGKEKRGSLQIGSQLARDINEAWVAPTEEGRKIIVLSERWLGFGE